MEVNETNDNDLTKKDNPKILTKLNFNYLIIIALIILIIIIVIVVLICKYSKSYIERKSSEYSEHLVERINSELENSSTTTQ